MDLDSPALRWIWGATCQSRVSNPLLEPPWDRLTMELGNRGKHACFRRPGRIAGRTVRRYAAGWLRRGLEARRGMVAFCSL